MWVFFCFCMKMKYLWGYSLSNNMKLEKRFRVVFTRDTKYSMVKKCEEISHPWLCFCLINSVLQQKQTVERQIKKKFLVISHIIFRCLCFIIFIFITFHISHKHCVPLVHWLNEKMLTEKQAIFILFRQTSISD